jgi:hypothetical protein
LKLKINIIIHQIIVDIIAQINQIVLIKIVFNIKFKTIAITIILTLSLTFPKPANILKLIHNNIFNIINIAEYCSSSQDFRNLIQNKIDAISGHKIKNIVHNHNDNTGKYL